MLARPEGGEVMPAVEPTELSWLTSSACDSSECVEVARRAEHVLIRDSTNGSGPVLEVQVDAWRTFIDDVTCQPTAALPIPSEHQGFCDATRS